MAKITIPGTKLQAEVVSTETCAQPGIVRLAMRLCDADLSECPEGAHGGVFCMTCNQELVLAPSGHLIVAAGGKDWVCVQCFSETLKPKN